MRTLVTILFLCFLLTGLQSKATSIQLTPYDATCGNATGKIDVYVTGGMSPYTFLWSDGSNSSNRTGLSPGVYTIYVTDANADVDSATTVVGNAPQLNPSGLSYLVPPMNSSGTHPCTNQCNGVMYLDLSNLNGQAPYSIYSSDPTHNIGYYAPGQCPTVEDVCTDDVFFATVSDANGCTGVAYPAGSYPPNSFTVNVTVLDACNGMNGSILAAFTNTQSLSYSGYVISSSGDSTFVGPSSSTFLADSLPADTYTIRMRVDLSAPSCDTTFTVIVPDAGFNCGEITGIVYLDSIADCIADINEPLIPSRKIRINPGPFYTNADSTGNFAVNLPFGSYTFSTVNDMNFTNICASPLLTLSLANDSLHTEIGDSAEITYNLGLNLFSGIARPGFSYLLYGYVHNSNFSASTGADLILQFDPGLILDSVSLPFIVNGPGQVTISIPSIPMFSFQGVYVWFTIPSSTPIGNILQASGQLNSILAETYLSDNSDTLNTVVTGSFDPNDKTVWPTDDTYHYYFLDIEDELRYTIRFQNTGTDTAFNIVLIDTLDQVLDLSTFRVLGSSHPFNWQIIPPDVLKVTYSNILLPDSNINEPLSHGLFSFAIKPDINIITIPYVLYNTAAIYFDFNAPVITNTEFSTLDMSVGLTEPEHKSISVYPNPAKNNFRIQGISSHEIKQVQLLDIQGRVCKIYNPSMEYNCSNLEHGIYLIRCYTKSGQILNTRILLNK